MQNLKKGRTLIILLLMSLSGSTSLFAQNSKLPAGKYCDDLGFGWYCIDFQKNGTYKEVGGHSYRSYKANGKWFSRNDTIIAVPAAKRKIETDTSYYFFNSDSLYSVYWNDKIKKFERSTPLTKQ